MKNIFSFYKDKIQSRVEAKKLAKDLEGAIELIERVGILENMGSAFNFDAFKIRVQNIIKENNSGFLFMGDIDNLGHLNMISKDKEKVDELIKNIIKNIKVVLKNNNVREYEIGKLGDEIFIYSSDISDNQAKQLNDKLNEIKSSQTTISFGYTDNLKNGLEEAIKLAEIKMKEIKNNKKFEALNGCKSKKELLKKWEEEINDRLRINEKDLREKDLETYKRNRSIIMLKIIKRIKEHEQFDEIDSSHGKIKDLTIEKEIENIENEIRKKYTNIKSEQLQILCIKKILEKMPIKSVQRIDFFKNEGYKKLKKLTPIGTLNNLRNTAAITIHIGNIKHVNDKYGHIECDKMIYSTVNYIIGLLKECGIKTKMDIVSNRISDYTILINRKTNPKSIEIFRNKLKDYSDGIQLSVYISSARVLLGKQEKSKIKYKDIHEKIVNLFQKAYKTNCKENEISSNKEKINRTDLIEESAVKSVELIKILTKKWQEATEKN